MLDSSALDHLFIPLGVVVPSALWLGRKIIAGTRAVDDLTHELKAMRTLLDEKANQKDLEHWIERLGYKNETLDLPTFPRKNDAA